MSYEELYRAVQQEKPKIKTGWLRDRVISITHIQRVKETWTGVLNDAILRGFWIEGPLGPPINIADNEALIVLARHLDKSWRRFVYTKELMHAFDTNEERADTSEKFETQIEKFGDPTKETSPMFRAEQKAFWRALGALCPEEFRLSAQKEIQDGLTSLDVVATKLKIPTTFARELFRDDYLKIIEHVLKSQTPDS